MGKGTQIGLVGFFDILGYQNLLLRNEPEKIAAEVIPILTGAGSEVTEQLKFVVDFQGGLQSTKQKLGDIIKSIEWLVFSDTILITMPIDTTDNLMLLTSWIAFLSSSMLLQRKLFKAGLPIRGAIDYGKFYTEQHCFAGQPIVNAYQICNQLELAACVLSDAAEKEYKRPTEYVKNDNLKVNDVLVTEILATDYLIPLKDKKRHMLTVTAQTYDYNRTDIRNQVLNAFGGKNKDIPRSVQDKINNTEQWLQYLFKLSEKRCFNSNFIPPPTPPK